MWTVIIMVLLAATAIKGLGGAKETSGYLAWIGVVFFSFILLCLHCDSAREGFLWAVDNWF